MIYDRLRRAFAPDSDYDRDLEKTTPDDDLAYILARPLHLWTYTDALRAMNARAYFSGGHPDQDRVRDRVMAWFAYAYPGKIDLGGGQRHTVGTSWHPEDRRAEDEVLARRAAARLLQSYGRHGDTILAHITPQEAMLLNLATDGGSVNPHTGLLEFWEGEEKKEGSYIWHTVGDSKVRSSHAERDGKVFSWDDPPEGGHPGEAPNCRCWAEDVKENDCSQIADELYAAWRRHDALHEPIMLARSEVAAIESRLAELVSERDAIWAEKATAAIPARLSRRFLPGQILTTAYLAQLERKLDKIEREIATEKRKLSSSRENLSELEYKRNNHEMNAIEYERRYKKCFRIK